MRLIMGASRQLGSPSEVSDRNENQADTLVVRKKSKFGTRKKLPNSDMEEKSKKVAEELEDVFMPQLSDLADFRFRSELIRMMGTEIIRLSDQNWSSKFQYSLRKDYERQLREQEFALAEAERIRLHRLRIEGVLTDSGSKLTDELMKRAFISRSAVPESHKHRFSQYLSPWRIFIDQDSNKKERTLYRERQARNYRPTYTIQEELELRRAPPPQPPSPQAVEFRTDYLMDTEQEAAPVSTESRRESLTVEERRNRRYKRLPPDIRRLYQEEHVDELYRLAEEVVRKYMDLAARKAASTRKVTSQKSPVKNSKSTSPKGSSKKIIEEE